MRSSSCTSLRTLRSDRQPISAPAHLPSEGHAEADAVSGSLFAACECLVDELVELLCLIGRGDRADDRLADDVAVLVDDVRGRERVQTGGELTGLAVGGEPEVGVGHAFFRQNVLRLGDGGLVAVEREGVDADDRAALRGEVLVERLKVGQLTDARVAGGEPEVHDRDAVAGKELAAVDVIAVEILALKAREFHRVAAGGGHAGLLRAHAVTCAGRRAAAGILLLEDGELALDLLDLLGAGLERLELIGREAVLRALNRGEQEVAVVRAVLDHGAVFVGRQKHLVPELGVCGENVVFLLHELLIELGCFVGAVRLGRDQGCDVGAAVRFVLAFARRARREAEHHREREQERHKFCDFLHHDSSV